MLKVYYEVDRFFNHIGLRFADETIPTNASILEATLTLYASDTDTYGAISTTIKGIKEADSDCDIWAAGDGPSSKPTTNASVAWDIPNLTANSSYSPDDLSTIIQEIIDTGNWSLGQALGLDIYYADSSETDLFKRFHSYDAGNASYYATLYIKYRV